MVNTPNFCVLVGPDHEKSDREFREISSDTLEGISCHDNWNPERWEVIPHQYAQIEAFKKRYLI
jgi:hypothetical protein